MTRAAPSLMTMRAALVAGWMFPFTAVDTLSVQPPLGEWSASYQRSVFLNRSSAYCAGGG